MNGDRIIVSDKFKKERLAFPFNDVNYSKINQMLNGRVYIYAHAVIDDKTLNVVAEAPFQGW